MTMAKSRLKFIIILLAIIFLPAELTFSQRIVDKNKGDHNQTKKGYMDGNLAATVYYNFGEIADWQNEPSRSGVWPKGTNHTYVDGVAIIVQAEATDPQGNIIHPLESNYYEFTDTTQLQVLLMAGGLCQVIMLLIAVFRQEVMMLQRGRKYGRIDQQTGRENGMDFLVKAYSMLM